MESERVRFIEVYVGITYGSDSGPWFTVVVDVPFDMPEEEAKQLAQDKVLASTKDEMVAFSGIYHYWSDENMDEFLNEDMYDDPWDYDLDYYQGPREGV